MMPHASPMVAAVPRTMRPGGARADVAVGVACGFSVGVAVTVEIM